MTATSDSNQLPRPLALDGSPALLLGPSGRTGVVLIEDWGYEGLCARRSMRLLAELLAREGYPVLRFDLPGMGGSLDCPESIEGIDRLDQALDAAIDALKAEAGAEQIVLAGLGLGALLAARRMARNRQSIGALVLLAPLLSGRLYLREAQIRGAMIAERTRVAPDLPEGAAMSVAGLPMSTGLARDIKAASLGEAAIPDDCPVLCLPRPGRTGEEEFAAALLANCQIAASIPLSGYDAMMTDPTLAEAPIADIQAIADWLQRVLPNTPSSATGPETPRSLVPALLKGNGFCEELVTLGRRGSLVGTLCMPAGQVRRGRTVLFLTAGGTPRTGWGMATRETARDLARQGIASLRLDVSDIGDSAAAPGAPSPVHYSARQQEDIADALAFLETRNAGEIIATGACSGAYLALRGAIADARIKGAVCVNLQRFLWDPRENIGDLLRFDHGDTADYARKLFDPARIKKLLKGEVPVFALIGFLIRRALNRIERASAPYALGLTTSSRLRRHINNDLATLDRRGQTVDLIYSENDPGLPFLAQTLGARGKDASKYSNLRLTFLDATDHNLTPISARTTVRDTLLRHALADIAG